MGGAVGLGMKTVLGERGWCKSGAGVACVNSVVELK